jgi:hypothetical protein
LSSWKNYVIPENFVILEKHCHPGKLCHPERSEGPAFRGEQQVLGFAQDDK